MRIMTKFTGCLLAVLTAASAVSCASVTELENRLDQLANSPSYTAEVQTEPVVTVPETAAPVAETEPTASAPEQNEKKQFSEFAPPYIFAVTFTYFGREEFPAITEPDIIWEALAWYGGYNSFFNGKAEISDDELKSAMKVITGSDEFIECPDDWISDGSVQHDNGVYSFPDFNNAMEMYFDGGEFEYFYVAGDQQDAATGVIRQTREGEAYDFTVYFEFAESGDSYILEHHIFGDDNLPYPVEPDEGELENPEPVSYDRLNEIADANDLDKLIGEDEAMRQMFSYVGDITDITYVFYKNGHIATASTYQSNEGGDSYGAYYMALEINMDEDGTVVCSPSGGTTEMYDLNYSNYIRSMTDLWIEQNAEVYLYYDDGELEGLRWVSEGEYDTIKTTYSLLYYKDSLRVYSSSVMTEMDTGDGVELYGNTIRYETVKLADIDNPLVAKLNDFDGDLKTVTMVVLGEYGYTNEYVMPGSWRFSTYVDDENIYADENCSEHFVYPGDGVDYTIYISYAKG